MPLGGVAQVSDHPHKAARAGRRRTGKGALWLAAASRHRLRIYLGAA